ncbi:hypothetical protein C8R43DRAFT_941737 [Mycena crocata]|nr:hypothetical protein C8R43DRAFT_941737 [Mycena crocata]
MRDLPDDYDHDGMAADAQYEDNVLRGHTAVDLSHAGGALTEEEIMQADQTLLKRLQESHKRPNSKLYYRKDHRTHRDRTKVLFNVFAPQMERMVDAYVAWSLAIAEEDSPPTDIDNVETNNVLVVDMFTAYYVDVSIARGDAWVVSAHVRQGLIPVSAYIPSAVITTRALEVYRVTHLQCPRLGIQAFVHALCNIHGIPLRPYLATQFSVALSHGKSVHHKKECNHRINSGAERTGTGREE